MMRLLAGALACLSWPVAAQPAMTTATMVDAVGIVARPTAATAGTVLAQLRHLGIRHVRVAVDSAHATAFQALCREGVGLLMLQDGTPSLDVARSLGRTCIDGAEGGNEINNDPARFRIGRLVGWPAIQARAAALWAEAQAWDPSLPVLTPSQSVGRPVLGGDMRGTANRGNVHSYTSDGWPPVGLQPQIAAQAGVNAPGLPFWLTETGYATYAGGVSEADQAVRLLQSVLSGLRLGAQRIYLYQLQDQCADGADPECRYGLFRADGSAKPAAAAVRRLLAITGYPPGAAPAATPRVLGVRWRGLPGDAYVLEFVAGNGAHRFALWREAPPGPVAPVSVTVLLPGTGTVQVYDPIVGTGRIQPLVRADTAAFRLGAHPLIVQVEGL